MSEISLGGEGIMGAGGKVERRLGRRGEDERGYEKCCADLWGFRMVQFEAR